MNEFQSESRFDSCVNVIEFIAHDRGHVCSLGDSTRIWTHNHLVRKRTLNHLAKLASLAKWLSAFLQIK